MHRESDRTSGGFALAGELSDRADRSISSLFGSCSLRDSGHWCIAALGGYGRREMCPFSDLDLLFLMDRQIPQTQIEEMLKEMLYPLWDSGFIASYSIRTIKQALSYAKRDFFFRTSLIGARYVCGSESTFRTFVRSEEENTYLRNSRKFVSDLAFHTQKRHEKYGDTVYFLEPHIKEGHGGLRDYNSILWVDEVQRWDPDAHQFRIDRTDLDEVHRIADFLTKVRFLLHRLAGRKTDQLHIEYQEMLAAEMGYTATGGEVPVEAFLKDFHTRALTLRTISDGLFTQPADRVGWRPFRFKKTIDDRFSVSSTLLDFSDAAGPDRDPLLLLKAFVHLSEKGLSLTPAARSRIKFFIGEEKGIGLRENREACAIFLKILDSPEAENALTGMLETGVIEQLIPEFHAIKGRTIFDVYHTYTIDLHSIHTVCELKRLESSESEAFSRITDREVLYLSSFLHDIGKGYGRPHADEGAEIIKPIARRFGFDDARTELTVFLVRNHLLMADIAQKRDLSEEKVIFDLAQKITGIEKLAMLYLITVADSKATGPNAWNEWKDSLLRELYKKTLHVLERGILKDRKNASRLEMKWKQLIARVQNEKGSHLSGRLWALPQAYVLSFDIDDIRMHGLLSANLSGMEEIKTEVKDRKNHARLTVIAKDRPGLFALITGILAMNRLDIISADIFTWYDGTAVDTFRVLPPWKDYSEWHAIERQFRGFLTGTIDIDSKLTAIRRLKTEEPLAAPRPGSIMLSIDNESSDFFSLIEVRAPRRIGLIHDVSKTISEFGLDIHRSFVSRSSDLSSSVYYVADADGEKIMEESRQKEMLDAIRRAIEGPLLNTSPKREKGIQPAE